MFAHEACRHIRRAARGGCDGRVGCVVYQRGIGRSRPRHLARNTRNVSAGLCDLRRLVQPALFLADRAASGPLGLCHLPQTLRFLVVWGVSMSVRPWRRRAASAPRAQAVHVHDPVGDVLNRCEMRWAGSGAALTIDKSVSCTAMTS